MEICIVGKGSIGYRHATIFYKLGCKIIFFRTHQSTLKKKQNFRFKEISRFSDIKKNKISLVVISNPTSLHFRTLVKFSKLCKNFLIEKPMSNNLGELIKISKLVKKRKLNIFAGYMMRHDPRILKIKKILKNKKIILSNFTWKTYLPNWHPYENFRNSYAFNKKMGGGVIKTCSHEIDLTTMFNGPAKKVFCVNYDGNLGGNIDESVSIYIEHINGSTSEVKLNFGSKKILRTFKIYTQNFLILWDFKKKNIYLNKYNSKKKFIKVKNSNIDQIYENQNKFILKSLKTKKNIFFNSNYESEKIIHGALKSLKKKKIIYLN